MVVDHGADAAIDHEEHHVRLGQGKPDLFSDGAGEGGVLGGVVAAGVDHAQQTPSPLDLDLLAVAGDAGCLVDDGLARAAETVDERGLARVRGAHHNYYGGCIHLRIVSKPLRE